jgi:hypothetical protein
MGHVRVVGEEGVEGARNVNYYPLFFSGWWVANLRTTNAGRQIVTPALLLYWFARKRALFLFS